MLAADHRPVTPPSGGFMMVESAHVAEVGLGAAVLFARIVWRAERTGSWRASRAVMADETGMTLSQLRGAVQVLRDRGWLVSERTSPDDATQVWKPLIGAGHADNADFAPPPAESAPLPLQDSQDPPADFAISSLETVETTTTDTPLPPDMLPILTVVPDPGPDLAAEFDAFWGHYPRKVGKKAARTAFARARRTTDLEPIARGLMAQLPGMLDGDLRYVKHPTVWLNGECWNDEPGHVAPAHRSRDVFGDPETVRGAEALLASWQRPTALTGARS